MGIIFQVLKAFLHHLPTSILAIVNLKTTDSWPFFVWLVSLSHLHFFFLFVSNILRYVDVSFSMHGADNSVALPIWEPTLGF